MKVWMTVLGNNFTIATERFWIPASNEKALSTPKGMRELSLFELQTLCDGKLVTAFVFGVPCVSFDPHKRDVVDI